MAAGCGSAYATALLRAATVALDAVTVALRCAPTGAVAMHPLVDAALYMVLAGALVALGAWWLR